MVLSFGLIIFMELLQNGPRPQKPFDDNWSMPHAVHIIQPTQSTEGKKTDR